MPIRLCIESRCGREASYRGRCVEHQRHHNASINRAGDLIYNTKRWRIARGHYLFNHPLCEMDGCQAIAEDVHHRYDIADGGEPYAEANLQALCHPCHSRITRSRQYARG